VERGGWREGLCGLVGWVCGVDDGGFGMVGWVRRTLRSSGRSLRLRRERALLKQHGVTMARMFTSGYICI